MRRGHAFSPNNSPLSASSANLVRQAERLVDLDARFPAILRGNKSPADANESIELARLCVFKGLPAAASRFYGDAFTAAPDLAHDLRRGHRYNAACAAALAGSGRGQDAGQLSEPQRAAWRRQARDWLRADLAAWIQLLAKDPDKARAKVRQKMQHWLTDSDFAGLRGTEALAKLPEPERVAWKALWAQVGETLARATKQSTPEHKAMDQ
jgi:hypothetical protein